MPRNSLKYIKPVRSKGKLYVYFDTGQTKNGRPIYMRLPDMGDRDFPTAYARAMAARSRRESIAVEQTVPELIDLFQKSPKYRSYSAGTRKNYDIYLARLASLLPTAPADKLEPSDIIKLMDAMADTPGAANSLMSATAALYKWGRSRKHVSVKPTEDIELLETGEYDPWPEPLLEAALQSEDSLVRLSTHLLYFTGQRIGDCCKMGWAHISGDSIRVVQQKTGHELTIPIHPELAAELARADKGSLFILPGTDGKAIKPARVRLRLQAFAREHGCKVVAHGLRKSAVNALLEAGCSVAETGAITGQSIQVIEHYAKKRSQSKLASAAIVKWRGARAGGKK